MPPDKNKEKKWAFVDSRLVVREARKRGTINKKIILIGKSKYFNSFEAAERYRKQNKLKGIKTIPIISKGVPILPYVKKEPKPKTSMVIVKPKPKPKRQVVDRKAKKIAEIREEVNWIDEQIKTKETNLSKNVKEERNYWLKLREKTDDSASRKRYQRQSDKAYSKFQEEIYKLQKRKGKEKDKIVAVNLDFNKVNRLVKNTLARKSTFHGSSRVKGYGEWSTGYSIDKPTHHDPTIRIGWQSSFWAKPETKQAAIKKYKDKLKPVLKDNNIKFTEDEEYIYIGKK